MVDKSKLTHSQAEQMDALQMATEAPELIAAYRDYKQGHSSGVVEIHFSQGGIAKVFSNVKKTYK